MCLGLSKLKDFVEINFIKHLSPEEINKIMNDFNAKNTELQIANNDNKRKIAKLEATNKELLEALASCSLRLEHLCDVTYEDQTTGEAYCMYEACHKAKAAIAKAKENK
jgi:mevalonate kinase